MRLFSKSILSNLTKLRSGDRNTDPFDEILDLIAQDRYVLLLDGIAEREIREFTKKWIYLNSPVGMQSRGASVVIWLTQFLASFLVMEFHPDNLTKLWTRIRSEANPSTLKYVVELTTHFRMRCIGTEEELEMLTQHIADGYSFIHRSDKKIIDSVTPDNFYVTDEQFFDELPTVQDIQDLLKANSWLLALSYCHRFDVDFMVELSDLTRKQTADVESANGPLPAVKPEGG